MSSKRGIADQDDVAGITSVSTAHEETVADVAIIGAGVCGLTTAIGLARNGFSVCLFESRLSPCNKVAVQELAAAQAWLNKANAKIRRGRSPEKALAKASKIRNRYWGTYERNVLLDSHSLSYLEHLGVDTDSLPKLSSIDLNAAQSGPTFHAVLPHRKIFPEADGLSPGRALLQRDWAAQPALGQLEHLLLEHARKYSGIDVRFGYPVSSVISDKSGVTLLSTGDACKVSLAIIADGGGPKSLSRSLVARHVHHTERISLSVLRSDPQVEICNRSTSEVFSHNTLTDDGWLGIFCSGRTVSTSVNARGHNTGKTNKAWRALNNLGLTTDLVEPPVEINVEIAEAADILVDDHVVLAGDAAACGNPRCGLGVQFGLVWAQLLEQSIVQEGQQARLNLPEYRPRAADIMQQRRDFELAWMEIINRGIAEADELPRLAVSDPVLQSLSESTLDYQVTGKGRRYRFRFVIDATRIPVADNTAVAVFLRQFERICIEGNLRLGNGKSKRQPTVKARLNKKNRIDVQLGDESISFRSGTFSARRNSDGWGITLDSALGLQQSQGAMRSELPVEHLEIQLPDDFLDVALQHAARQAYAIGSLPLNLRLSLSGSQVLRWGPFDLRLHQDSRFNIVLHRGPELDITMERGYVEPLSVTSFARRTPMRSTRWMKNASALWNGLFDPLIDRAAAFASTTVRRIRICFRADDTALVVFYGLVPVSILLNVEDTQRLRSDFLGSALLGNLVVEHGEAVSNLKVRSA